MFPLGLLGPNHSTVRLLLVTLLTVRFCGLEGTEEKKVICILKNSFKVFFKA